MKKSEQRFHLGLGSRLALTNSLLVFVVLGALIATIAYAVSHNDEQRVEEALAEEAKALVTQIEASDQDLRRRTQALSDHFTERLSGRLALGTNSLPAGDTQAPALTLDGTVLNQNEKLVDDFTAATDAVATVFVRSGDDFIRVTTSLKNDKGQRVVGTRLDHAHPAYAKALAGEGYQGLATLFNRRYMTQYVTLRSPEGTVVGLSFVGLDFSEYLSTLKDGIRKLQVGKTGYFFVLDASTGSNRGSLVVHPTAEGESMLKVQDESGRAFVQDMLEAGSGVIRYAWMNSERGETSPRDQLTAYVSYPGWQWLVAASAYVDEYSASTYRLLGIIAAAGVLAVVALSLVWLVLIRRMVSTPVELARDAADRLAAGDLSATVRTERTDEIGDLLRSINHIGSGLAQVVETVRERADGVALASHEIAQGNMDLSKRTESQASALEQTAASMEELGSTVQRNAAQAQQASRLAQDASQVVADSGQAVARVVATMKEIDRGSQRIAEITGVIDGIAFQTNILALNAAVEAARAGDSGRGFAVVAGEVRTLAQRSAEAAKEIRVLIQDSVSQIQQGSAMVDSAGATMDKAVREIRQVTSIMETISHASVEQSTGVQQVGQAVSQMDQVTQQNAALVEEMAAAASKLSEQSGELVQTVGAFRLPT